MTNSKLLLEKLTRIEAMLCEQSILKKEVLTFSEAAKYVNLSPSYLYKLTSSGRIPHSKPRGKQIFFNRVELDKWLQQNRVKTNAEIETAAATHVTLKI